MSSSVDTLSSIADSDSACDDTRVERCEVVTDFHRLEEFWSDWQRLWETDPRAEVFQTPEWAKAWWKTFGPRHTLCTVVVFASDEVTGIVPLVRQGSSLRFLGTPEADYADIVCEDHQAAEVLTAALRAIGQSVPGWQECRFEHLSKHSRLVRHYADLPSDVRGRLHLVPAECQQTIIFRHRRDEVFKALLGKHHTKRLQNKLRKAGALRFRYLETCADADEQLPEFFRHHVRRHAAIGRWSAYADPEVREFLRAAIHEVGPERRVRFGVLELDGRPLAWALGFEVNGKFLLYQHTFDMDAGHFTPGEVLLWNTLEYARDHVAREFDFGKGDELYKDRFANYSRQTYSMFLEPAGMRGDLRGLGRSLQGRVQPGLSKLKELAKSQRSTLRAYRSARMWMLGTLGRMRQARKNGTLVQYGFHWVKEVFGKSIWSRRSSDVFALDASQLPSGGAASVGTTARENRTEVRFVQLGELVDLAWDHPEILSLNELSDCRQRLKNGDFPYIVQEKSEVLLVGWAASRCPAGEAEMNEAASNSELMVDEFWRARGRDLSAPYRALLTFLGQEAARRNKKLLVHCSAKQAQLRKELQLVGFRPKFRTTHYRIFCRFRRDSVSACANTALQPSQPV
jgi:CelD/BcsL family acetyltransferase involved in cellulose biosynthesis